MASEKVAEDANSDTPPVIMTENATNIVAAAEPKPFRTGAATKAPTAVPSGTNASRSPICDDGDDELFTRIGSPTTALLEENPVRIATLRNRVDILGFLRSWRVRFILVYASSGHPSVGQL